MPARPLKRKRADSKPTCAERRLFIFRLMPFPQPLNRCDVSKLPPRRSTQQRPGSSSCFAERVCLFPRATAEQSTHVKSRFFGLRSNRELCGFFHDANGRNPGGKAIVKQTMGAHLPGQFLPWHRSAEGISLSPSLGRSCSLAVALLAGAPNCSFPISMVALMFFTFRVFRGPIRTFFLLPLI